MARVSVIMSFEVPFETKVTKGDKVVGKVVKSEPYGDEGKFLVTVEVENGLETELHAPPVSISGRGGMADAQRC